jgi:hypothetical protein
MLKTRRDFLDGTEFCIANNTFKRNSCALLISSAGDLCL